MTSSLENWDGGVFVRIPADLLSLLNLRPDEPVEIREEGGRLVIEPIRLKTYDGDELITQITPENRHDLIDFGPPVGHEVW